jgi:hypothetical protein
MRRTVIDSRLLPVAAAAGAVASASAVHDAVHTPRVLASAMTTDAVMVAATDAELLLGQHDCQGGSSTPPVSASAQPAADSDGRDACLMTDVDADCCSVEADVSEQRRLSVQAAESEAAAVSDSCREGGRLGPSSGVSETV